MNTTEHDLRQIKFLEHVTEESQSKQHIVQDLIPVPIKSKDFYTLFGQSVPKYIAEC